MQIRLLQSVGFVKFAADASIVGYAAFFGPCSDEQYFCARHYHRRDIISSAHTDGLGFMRSMHPGRPRCLFKRLLGYGFVFVLAMMYTMMAGSLLHWPHWSGFALIGVWGVLIFYIAWRRSHRNQPGAPGVARPKIPYGRTGVPTLALLVCLVGASVEWDAVSGGSGRAWVALLWTAGVAASVWLAQRYRRTVVITALRAFVALAAIGAIAERTVAAVVVAAAQPGSFFSRSCGTLPRRPSRISASLSTMPEVETIRVGRKRGLRLVRSAKLSGVRNSEVSQLKRCYGENDLHFLTTRRYRRARVFDSGAGAEAVSVSAISEAEWG